jgi:Spy/CpxP family protein refolding chaperone
MTRKFNFKLGALGVILSAMLLIPAPGQAKEEPWGEWQKTRRAAAVKTLNLSPEKAKDFNAVVEKYAKERQELFERMKKSQGELQNAVAAATPDEDKIKDLVAAIRADQDKMIQSFKSQRDEELALMTPLQQGQYLLSLCNWRDGRSNKGRKYKNR